jgi:hypothetical protein
MANAKAIFGLVTGLVVVLAVLLGYALRAYRGVKKDYVHKLARKDSKTLTLVTSDQYSQSFLGASAQAVDWGAPITEGSIGPEYSATNHGTRLRVVDDRINMN